MNCKWCNGDHTSKMHNPKTCTRCKDMPYWCELNEDGHPACDPVVAGSSFCYKECNSHYNHCPACDGEEMP